MLFTIEAWKTREHAFHAPLVDFSNEGSVILPTMVEINLKLQ